MVKPYSDKESQYTQMLLYLGYNATKIDAKERKRSITTYFLVIVISSGIAILSKKKKGMRLDFNNR